jgi:hypothetical protein
LLANGAIDYKVDFGEKLSDSDSNSWFEEASLDDYGSEEEETEVADEQEEVKDDEETKEVEGLEEIK